MVPDGARSEPTAPAESWGTLELLPVGGRRIELLYVRLGGVYYVIPAARRTPWATETLQRGAADFFLESGDRRRASARLVRDAVEARTVFARFRADHGETAWSRYFEGRSKVIALDPDATAEPLDAEAMARAEFDAVAPGYARAVASDPADAYLRERSVARLRPLMATRDPLLEIGSGTGSETLPLLAEGHRIVAIDLSPGMLGQLRGRATAAGLVGQLTTIEGRLGNLTEALRPFSDGHFAGAYSTFGAFNLEPRLEGVGIALRRVLARDAPVFLGVLNRHAAMPLIAGVVGADWRAVGARLQHPIPAEGTRYPLDVYARRPAEITRSLGPGFVLEAVEAASVLAPPDDLPRLRKALGARGKLALRRWDARLARNRLGRDLGEWQFLTYRRRPERSSERV